MCTAYVHCFLVIPLTVESKTSRAAYETGGFGEQAESTHDLSNIRQLRDIMIQVIDGIVVISNFIEGSVDE